MTATAESSNMPIQNETVLPSGVRVAISIVVFDALQQHWFVAVVRRLGENPDCN
jgi:hypothetical protein